MKITLETLVSMASIIQTHVIINLTILRHAFTTRDFSRNKFRGGKSSRMLNLAVKCNCLLSANLKILSVTSCRKQFSEGANPMSP